MSFYFPYTLFSSSHPHNAVHNDKVQTQHTAGPRRQLPAHKRKKLQFQPSLDTCQSTHTLQWPGMNGCPRHIKTEGCTHCSALRVPTDRTNSRSWLIIWPATHSRTLAACLLCAAQLRGKSGRRQGGTVPQNIARPQIFKISFIKISMVLLIFEENPFLNNTGHTDT
jgi:hypothetical protein